MAAVAESVQTAIHSCEWGVIAKLLDTMELESSNPLVLQEWPHALHLLSHIYNKNLTDARFLWKRIPASIKQNNPELEAVWKLLQYYWARQYQGIWQALQAFQWSPQLQPFIDALTVKTRQELLDLIGTAYSTVRPAKVAAICGFTEQEALNTCLALGWQYDQASGTLAVAPKQAAPSEHNGFNQLQQLSEYMVQLEQ